MRVLAMTRIPKDLEPWRGRVPCDDVLLVYVLDPSVISRLVEDLASQGWLGPGMLEWMEEVLRKDLHRLAEQTLRRVAADLGCPDAPGKVMEGTREDAEKAYPDLVWLT